MTRTFTDGSYSRIMTRQHPQHASVALCLSLVGFNSASHTPLGWLVTLSAWLMRGPYLIKRSSHIHSDLKSNYMQLLHTFGSCAPINDPSILHRSQVAIYMKTHHPDLSYWPINVTRDFLSTWNSNTCNAKRTKWSNLPMTHYRSTLDYKRVCTMFT
jgi:hypothetical protein